MKGLKDMNEKERALIKEVLAQDINFKNFLCEELKKSLAADIMRLAETAGIKVVPISNEEEIFETKNSSFKRNKKSKKASEEKQWGEFFDKVEEVGVEHGEKAPKGSNVLAVGTKKNDKTMAAALINHRGMATNVIYSPVYEYPLVFAKTTMEELESIKKSILNEFPEDADIHQIGVNTTENGSKDNFYYDEIEDGNFCCRFRNKNGNIVYFGYIIDQDICFYKKTDGSISMISVKYFFMPRWGTKESSDNYKELKQVVLSLIDRAFNDKCETAIIEEVKKEANVYKKSKKTKKRRN